MILNKKEELLKFNREEKLKQLIRDVFFDWLPKSEMRETALNVALLLIVLDISKILSLETILGDKFEFASEGEKLL